MLPKHLALLEEFGGTFALDHDREKGVWTATLHWFPGEVIPSQQEAQFGTGPTSSDAIEDLLESLP